MRITKSLDVISIAAFLGAGWSQLQGVVMELEKHLC